MSNADEHKIQKFHGRVTDDYNLWRHRAEIALKGKGYWSKLQQSEVPSEVKEKASAMIVQALGDSALRVCISKIDEPLEMLELLDKRYASTRSATRISLLTAVYSKKYADKQNMARFVDEFESLFAQLERIGTQVAIPEQHKAPLLLASMGNDSKLESTVSALRLKDTEDLTWEAVTADLIQEYNRLKGQPSSSHSGTRSKQGLRAETADDDESRRRRRNPRRALRTEKGDSEKDCNFCGKKGHTSQSCFLNPDSSSCRLSKQALDNIRALKTSKGKETEKKPVRFGGTAVVKKRHDALQATKNESPRAYLDSGASVSLFKSTKETVPGTYERGSDETVQVAVGSKPIPCAGKGTLLMDSLQIPESLHVDRLNDTLVSVGQICDLGRIIVFMDTQAVILKATSFTVDESDIEATVPRNELTGLYEFQSGLRSVGEDKKRQKANSGNVSRDINLWHYRLAHLHSEALKSLHQYVASFPVLKGRLKPCHPCEMGKATKKRFKSHFEKAEFPGEVVHTDLAGPMPRSMEGSVYICTFTDQYSRFTHVAGIQSKSDASVAAKQYKEIGHVQKYFKEGVKRLHSDGISLT